MLTAGMMRQSLPCPRSGEGSAPHPTTPHFSTMNVRKYQKQVDEIMLRYGFIFHSKSKHMKYKHEKLNLIQVCSATPSDNYALSQIERQCRRSLAAAQ